MKTLLDQEKSKVYLIENALTKELKLELIEFLNQVNYSHDIFKFGSKEINSPRKTQSFCFEENLNYNFNQKFKSSTFIKDQNHILKRIANHLKTLKQSNNHDANKINYVLINYYRNGKDYIGWHSDNEKSIDSSCGIFSLSIGQERAFQMKHIQTKKTIINQPLMDNSLLIMCGENTQKEYKHQVPKRLKLKDERFNLTFRCIKK